MQHKGTQTIMTERLKLRRFQSTDARALHGNLELGYDENNAVEILKNRIINYENMTNYDWAIDYQGIAIGRIRVNELSLRDNYMQIGYELGAEYRNKGIMTEALKAVIRYLFYQVDVHRIYGQCRFHNIASAKVMQKSGMVYEGRQRKHYIENDGSYSDVDLYGIIKEDSAREMKV